MPTGFYITEVIGTGRRGDPWRSAAYDLGVKGHSSAIVANPDSSIGEPLSNVCLTKIESDNLEKFETAKTGCTRIPNADVYIAEAVLREEAIKAAEQRKEPVIVRPQFEVACARVVDDVKEMGGGYVTYETKELGEMMGVTLATNRIR